MENINVYLKKFKVAAAIAAAGIVLIIFLISKIVPAIQSVFQLQNDYKNQTIALSDAERQLQDLQDNENRKKEEVVSLSKAVFKPVTEGLDTESAISDEFAEILQLIKENKVKARSVKYDYDPQDDVFVKNAANQYHVCKVTTELIGTYSQFENFLRDLYKHEHFLEVTQIEINPYQKNKKILLINLTLKLYAQRDPSSVVNTPKPAAAAPMGPEMPMDGIPSPEMMPPEGF